MEPDDILMISEPIFIKPLLLWAFRMATLLPTFSLGMPIK